MTVSCHLRILLAKANVERARQGKPTLSLRRLAAESGVSLSVLAALNTGRNQRIDYATLDRLLNYFNCYFSVTINDLLIWERTPEGGALRPELLGGLPRERRLDALAVVVVVVDHLVHGAQSPAALRRDGLPGVFAGDVGVGHERHVPAEVVPGRVLEALEQAVVRLAVQLTPVIDGIAKARRFAGRTFERCAVVADYDVRDIRGQQSREGEGDIRRPRRAGRFSRCGSVICLN